MDLTAEAVARYLETVTGTPARVEDIERVLANVGEFRRQAAEKSFRTFIKEAWPHIEPNPFVGGWHIDAIADHLEAVSRGQIKRLLINVPPRTSKSTITSVMWPAWTWAQKRDPDFRLLGPAVRFVCASYAQPLGVDFSVATRRLVESDWYRSNYGERVQLTGDQNNKLKYDTTAGGARLVTSVGAGVTGRGGDIFTIDDPHSTQEIESDLDRESVLRWWRQTVQSRLNDPRSGAFVIIMQRIHEADLSGYILDTSEADWVHLCLPMSYEEDRHCVTVPLRLPDAADPDPPAWEDPRTVEGELLAPIRFDQKYVDLQAREVGPYVFAGQYQQRPSPAGGEIFKLEWWQNWPHDRFPVFDLMIASLDTAYTEKEENDWSALTIWGVWRDPNGLSQLMLVYAWRERMMIHPLVQKINKTCSRPMYPVDKILIEAKASGLSVAQELRRLFRDADYSVEIIDPKGDKVARAVAVQALFAPSERVLKPPPFSNAEPVTIITPGIIHSPDKAWADLVKNEAASFPKGKHDDLVDSMVQGLKWLRDTGFAKRREEATSDMVAAQQFTPAPEPLYDVG